MATSLATLEARLVKIDAAIDGTLDRNAAQYQINGRAISSLSLNDLQSLRLNTMREITRLGRSGGIFVPTGFISTVESEVDS